MAGPEAADRLHRDRRKGPSVADAVLTRLGGLAELSARERQSLAMAAAEARTLPARRSFVLGQEPVVGPLIVLSGWAAQVRQFANGRRQVLGLFLPGEMVQEAAAQAIAAPLSFLTLTEVVLARAPCAGSETSGLGRAYRGSRALEEGYLLRQIARLGQLDARERIFDWLLELRDRLDMAGLVRGSHFPLRATQEIMGDTLGLTSVHVNRTLQAMRREGLIDTQAGDVRILGRLTSY